MLRVYLLFVFKEKKIIHENNYSVVIIHPSLSSSPTKENNYCSDTRYFVRLVPPSSRNSTFLILVAAKMTGKTRNEGLSKMEVFLY